MLTRILEATTSRLVQDASEYGFVGFLGGVAAFFAALILRWVDNPLSNALIAPALIGICVITEATAMAAFCRTAENLQPDAGRAFVTIMLRAGTFLRPWVPLSAVLCAVVFVSSVISGFIGGWPQEALVFGALVVAAPYAMSRSFYAPSLLTQRLTPREAEMTAAVLARRSFGDLAAVWGVILAPAALVTLIAVTAGFGPASAAITGFVFAASMPVAALATTLLFADAAARATGTRPPSAAAAARRQPTRGRY